MGGRTGDRRGRELNFSETHIARGRDGFPMFADPDAELPPADARPPGRGSRDTGPPGRSRRSRYVGFAGDMRAGGTHRSAAKWSCNAALSIVLYFLTKTVYFGLIVLQVLMFLRALLSWVMPDDDNMITDFIYAATEPIIAPVRGLLDRFEFVRAMPFDISFFVTFIILVILQNALPTVSI